MTEKKSTDIHNMDFETAFTALQENITLLENESLPLEQALAYFERGQDLSKHCAALLDRAELKVKQLSMEPTQESEEKE
jgi:exodeoxyribonuclease VII small subunit